MKESLPSPESGEKIKRDRKELEFRRISASRMFEVGKSQYVVAKHFGVSTAATNKWHTSWKQRGEKGLLSKGHLGFVSKYTPDKKRALKKIILKRPSSFVFLPTIILCDGRYFSSTVGYSFSFI